MSLKEKLDEIKGHVQTKKNVEQIEGGKKIVGAIGSERQTLEDRINGLTGLLGQLEGSYSAAKGKLAEFKGAKAKIIGLYDQYADYLKEQGIVSVGDMLRDEKLSVEEDIVDYHQKGAAPLKGKDKRGALGEEVAGLGETKKKLKVELPEENLDFRGGFKAGENRPRAEAILKIKEHISKLQAELDTVAKREDEAKKEYLPAIKEMILKKFDEQLPAGQGYSLSPFAANLNFMSDEIMKFAGSRHWPDVRDIALDTLMEKFRERGIKLGRDEVEKSLDAEKFIFDVEDLRSNHGDLLKMNQDLSLLTGLERNIDDDMHDRRQSVTIQDKKAYPSSILKQAEALKAKNPEAKRVCEEAKKNLLAALEEAQAGLKPGLLAGKDSREAIQKAKNQLEKSKAKLNELKVPENYYNTERRWDFHNGLHDAAPDLGYRNENSRIESLKESLDPIWRGEAAKVSQLSESEGQALSQVGDDIYHFGHASEKIAIGGLKVPVMDIEKNPNYMKMNAKDRLDAFLARLSGQELTQADMHNRFEAERAIFAGDIKRYPDSAAILARLEELEKRFSDKFGYTPELIDVKRHSRRDKNYRPGMSNRKDGYQIKQELFYE